MKIGELKDFIDRECVLNTVIIINITEGKTSKGNKYFSVTLQDSSGTVEAKKWEVSPTDEAIFIPKNVIKVEGYPIIYNNSQLQFKITDAEIVENYQEKDLIITAPINMDYYIHTFNQFIEEIQDIDYKNIVKEILKDKQELLIYHPAAKSNHHEYAGGLIHHEVSMLLLAKDICKLYPSINKDLLYAGIILHDIGKIEELSGPIATEYTLKGRLIGHISLIQSEIVNAANKFNVDDEKRILLQHMILSHHGKLEYGSPVLPLTLEAEVMYQIDNLDSKIVMINKALKDVEEGGFSNRIMGLDGRTFYKHK